MKLSLLLIVAAALFIAACTPLTETQDNTPSTEIKQDISTMTDENIQTTSSGTKYLVHPDEFRSGGPGLGGIGEDGGIPALLDPTFIEADKASYLPDNDFVLGIVHKGEARAYPYQILVWHEMANDIIQGDPILISYCPLCFTGVAFNAEIDGKRELFGVSGKLYNSELVMYDQSTKSYWPQSLGKAVVGERTGTTLKKIPIDVATWGDWRAAHPDTTVLSDNTGFNRRYGSNPYGKDDDFSDIGFRLGIDNPDPRLPAQTIVYGLELDSSFTAYPESTIEQEKVINNKVANTPIVIWQHPTLNAPRGFIREVNDKILTFSTTDDGFTDAETSSTWNGDGLATAGELEGTQLERVVLEPVFWFAWAAFHPETSIYEG